MRRFLARRELGPLTPFLQIKWRRGVGNRATPKQEESGLGRGHHRRLSSITSVYESANQVKPTNVGDPLP
jgi:hypothetical protein